jgi:hypothetical protein
MQQHIPISIVQKIYLLNVIMKKENSLSPRGACFRYGSPNATTAQTSIFIICSNSKR